MFGFVDGRKQTFCYQHLSLLTDQRLSLFAIEAYQFVELPSDYPLYLKKLQQVKYGLGSVAALKDRCDCDLQKVLMYCETASIDERVEKTLQVVYAQAQQCCEMMKKRLNEARRHIRKLTTKKHAELNKEDIALCGITPNGPLFRVGGKENRHYYLEVTETGAQIEPSQAELARLRIITTVERGTDMQVMHISTDVQIDTNCIIQKCAERAVEKRAKGDYMNALKKLLRGRDLLEGQESPLLCFHLGQIRIYFGEWTKAEAALKQGLKIQLEKDASSELAIQLSNSLLELYHQREMLEETMEQGEWIFHTFQSSGYVSELLHTLYFLANACYRIDEEEKGLAFVETWTRRLIAENDCSQYLLLCIQADKLRVKKREMEAAKRYEQALESAEQLPVYSYFTVYARNMLCNCYRTCKKAEEAKHASEKTATVYLAHFPQSPVTFRFFDDVGDDMSSEAELRRYQELMHFYSVKFPQSLGFANFLYNVAFLSENAGLYNSQAKILLSSQFPTTPQYADFLISVGTSFQFKKNRVNASKYLLKAYQVALSFLPNCGRLKECLWMLSWGESINDMKVFYRLVKQQYLTRFPQSRHFPVFLRAFGDFYEARRLYVRAEKRYLQAFRICYESFPRSHIFAKTLKSLDILYTNMGKREAIEPLCQKALTGLTLKDRNYARCFSSLAKLYATQGKATAENCFLCALRTYAIVDKRCNSFEGCLLGLAEWYLEQGKEAASEVCIARHWVKFQSHCTLNLRNLRQRYESDVSE